MKYIPADELIAEIRKLRSESCISESDDYYEYAKSEIIDIITSLQQEQPEVDLEKELKEHIDDEWSDEWSDDVGNWIRYRRGTTSMEVEDVKEIARHFYELGLNARKEK